MRLPLKSPIVASWLYVVAALIVLIVLVGGATRLTGSGLSITEWKPIHGVIPPMGGAQWTEEFAKYQQIPQYSQVNANMTLDEFKGIYWWEWAHRILGRIIGLAIIVPFAVFLFMKEVPKRLIWRCAAIMLLIGLQGAVGWWMVYSGLSARVDVAPERLMTHLGLALVLLVLCIWTALEAWAGQSRGRGAAMKWQVPAYILLGLVFFQALLGALVAGNNAGLVYNDWPLMNGRFAPYVDYSKGLWLVLFHDQGMVQFLHRLTAYGLLVLVTVFAIMVARKCLDGRIKGLAVGLAVLCWAQAALGVAALVTNVHIHTGLTHQMGAVIVLILATLLAWHIARGERVFRQRSF